MNCICRLLFSVIFCYFFYRFNLCIEKNRNEMRQFKLLLAAIALLCAMPCFGKQINLRGKWEHKKKSIPIGLPMDASIEEANRELIVNFHEDLDDVCVIVTSSTGEVIYNEKVQTRDITFLIVPLDYQSMGMVQITDGYNNIYGEFVNN